MKDELSREAIGKLPLYIPGKQVDEVTKEFKIKEVVKLASNENPFGPSPKAVEAIIKDLGTSSVYPDQHHTLLREALAKKWGLSKDNFICGNGSDEIMSLIAQVFLNAGEEVILSRNTFSMYEFVSKIMDGELIFTELRDLAYDLPSIRSKVSDRTKLIFLCNPNNPTGTIFTKNELEKFMSNMPEKVIVVLDEAYAEFADDPDFPDGTELVKKGRNIIVLRTFSKAYGLAGLRVGYGIASAELIKYLSLAKLPFNVGRISQLAATAALDDGDFLKLTLDNNKEGKKFLYNELERIGLHYAKTQANFIFIDLKKPSDKVFMELMRQGVIVRPLSSFGFPEAIRVSIGTGDQNQKLVQALKKVL